ncbi:Eco57I restriction-modification methylase domain-containing protein [Helicobacter pylori]|uniref:Eco57I restriction-modification methylase domain-containing protein n=1 Tax=Helicobacter pylori TaxID=210 RepID=UPI003CC65812
MGSGHFLVSALNEMVWVAYKLGLIASLYRHELKLENDEIIIHTPEDKVFKYTIPHSENDPHHQIQKELFELKKSIIENCLFGVDINPNSCEITKLRLWIELLKYSYYIFEEGKNTNNLETLPNIDINIKCANSLISRFNLNDDLKKIPNIKQKIQEYKDLVAQYKDPNPLYPLNKADLTNKIQDLKNTFSLTLKDPKTKAELEKTIEKHIKKYNFFALDDKSLLDGLNYFTPSLFGTLKLSPKEEEEAFASYGRIRALRKKLDDALSGGEYQNAFEWRFEFPEVLDDEGDFSGFDCIIGNPPYIRQEHIKDLKPLLQKQYQDFYNSSSDIYTYFFALAYHLLKEKGFSAFITSNKYARAKYGTKLRELLLKKTTIVSYMELNALKVFESATVDTSIIHFIKQAPLKESVFKYYEPTPNDKNDLKKTHSLPMRQNALSTESFIFANTTLLDLRDKMEKSGTPLKDWGIQIYRGILTGCNEAFIIPTEKRDEILKNCDDAQKDERGMSERERTIELIKPILRGKDIKRYSYEWAGEWVIFIPWHFPNTGSPKDMEQNEKDFSIHYPIIYAHLLSHKDELLKRNKDETGKRYEWYCLQRWAASYLQDFEKEKIVYGEIVQEPRFYLDNGECELGYFYAEATSFILTGEHLHYLLGMLHSKLITFAFKTFYAGGGLGESGYRYKKAFIERLPIPKITTKNQELADKIIALVDKILQSKEKDPKANTQGLEKEIDALVYQLYHLTDEEIKIIEDGQ